MQSSCVLSVLFIFVSLVVVDIHAISKCDISISNAILASNDCPENVLETLEKFGTTAYLVNPSYLAETVECVNGFVGSAVKQGFHPVTLDTHFKNKTAAVGHFKEYNKGCGHVTELADDGTELEIYFYVDEINKAFGYYLCSLSAPKSDEVYGACAVSRDKLTNSDSLEAVKKFKALLEKSGIHKLVDMKACSNKNLNRAMRFGVPYARV